MRLALVGLWVLTLQGCGVHDAPHDMALPAVLVAHAGDGAVRWTRVGESIADRPGVDEVVEAVRRLGPPR